MQYFWLALFVLVAAVLGVLWWARSSYDRQADYDLVVVGGGAAGLTAAGMAARFGAKTLLVEAERLGGDCTWTGCIPSKGLLAAANVVYQARTADRHGLEPATVELDLAKVLATIAQRQQAIYEHADSPQALAKHGVETLRGRARFVSPRQILVSRENEPAKKFRFRYCVVASGSRPRIPEIEGLDQGPYLTNENLFELAVLPTSLLVIGGGPIGVEMAQAFSRLGTKVVLVQRSERLVPKAHARSSSVLVDALRAEGVEVLLNVEVQRLKWQGATVTANISDGQRRLFDTLLVAVGRVPSTVDLGLDAANIVHGDRGIEVDGGGRTNNRRVFACGDVAVGPNFTHWAEHSAKVAVSRAILGAPLRTSVTVPWTIFTAPEVAQVGCDLGEIGGTRAYEFPYSMLDRSLAEGSEQGHIVVHAKRGRPVHASVVGERAGEIAAELGLAIEHKISLRKLADTIHAYPSFAQGTRRVADQWYIGATPVRVLGVLKRLRGLKGRVVAPSEGDVL